MKLKIATVAITAIALMPITITPLFASADVLLKPKEVKHYKMPFNLMVSRLEAAHRDLGRQVIYIAQGSNVDFITPEVFAKYRDEYIYDFAKSATEDSAYAITVKKMESKDGIDVYVLSLESKQSKLDRYSKKNGFVTVYDPYMMELVKKNKKLAVVTSKTYDVARMVEDLKLIKKRAGTIQDKAFDTKFFELDLDKIINNLEEQVKVSKEENEKP